MPTDDVFCPICGAVAPANEAPYRFRGSQDVPEYRGPRCEHGFPDVSCAEPVALDPLYRYDFTSSIREYLVSEYAQRPGMGKLLTDWVRPCAVCQHCIALAQGPMLQHELEKLAGLIANEARAAQDRVRSLAVELAKTQEILVDLESLRRAADTGGPAQSKGFVYAIGNAEVVKIGWSTKHPERANGRLKQLRTSAPIELELLGTVIGTLADEHNLHQRFSEHRIRGEWFRCVDEIRQYFAGDAAL